MDIIGIIIAIVVLGFIIFIHELGHFFAAKRSGIRVERFSIGFGPKLLGFTRGDTEYCLSALPFGGYVKMAGEYPSDDSTGAPDEFFSASVGRRIFVAVSGPVMNFALAVVVFAVFYMIGTRIPESEQTTEIGYVHPGHPAASAGIQAGDKILSIDGRKVTKWSDIAEWIFTHPNKNLDFLLLREGEETTVTVKSDVREEKIMGEKGGIIGVSERTRVKIGEIIPNSLTEQADIIPDDTIYTINGKPVRHPLDIITEIEQHPGADIRLELMRDDSIHTVTLTPSLEVRVTGIQEDSLAAEAGIQLYDTLQSVDVPLDEPIRQPVTQYKDIFAATQDAPEQAINLVFKSGAEMKNVMPEFSIEKKRLHESLITTDYVLKLNGLSLSNSVNGILLSEPVELQKYNFITAWGKGLQESVGVIGKIFRMLKDLILHKISAKYLSGPVGIVKITATVARSSISGLLYIVAFISVNLAIVNLLPIPIADGGQIILFLLEKARGKPLSQKKQLIIQQVSIGLLIFLFVLITWNDISKWIRY